MRVTSTTNPRVKAAARLRDRQGRNDQQRIIIDGVREIGLAVASGIELIELYYFPELCRDEQHAALLKAAGAEKADLIEVTPAVMEKLALNKELPPLLASLWRGLRSAGWLI